MKQADVQIGDTYRTKVGDRLATAKVMRSVGKRGGSRVQFECITIDTHQRIYRTAAKLRPLVDVAKPAHEMGAVQVTPSGARELTMEEFMAGLREAARSMPDTL